jgi:hypothetical protein
MRSLTTEVASKLKLSRMVCTEVLRTGAGLPLTSGFLTQVQKDSFKLRSLCCCRRWISMLTLGGGNKSFN